MPLTLADCVRLALDASPDIQSANARLRQARAAKLQAASLFHPQAAFTAQHTLFGFDEFNRINRGGRFSSDTREFVLSANWNLFRSGQDLAGLNQARHAEAGSKETLQEARQTVALASARAFFLVLSASRTVELELDGVANSSGTLAMTERLHRSGLRPYSDVLNARLQLASFEMTALSAATQLQVERAPLNILLDRPPLEETRLAGDPYPRFEPGRLQDHLGEAYERRPLLRAAREAIEAAEAGRRLALGQALPTFTMDGFVFDRLEVPRVEVAPGFFVRPLNPFWQINVGISVPIWDGTARYQNYRFAKAEVKAAKSAEATLRRQVANEVSLAYVRLASSGKILALVGKELAAAQERLDTVRRLYQKGEALALEVTTAQDQVRTAALQEVQAGYAASLAWVDLLTAKGTRLPGAGVD